MPEQNEKLKVCPFCGSSARRGISYPKTIFCESCNGQAEEELWNTRSPAITREELKEIVVNEVINYSQSDDIHSLENNIADAIMKRLEGK